MICKGNLFYFLMQATKRKMRYLFGNLLTYYAPASLNRGEHEGNEQLIQQILWKKEPHTTISPFSIRWKIRYQFQQQGKSVYEKWDDVQRARIPQSHTHDPQKFIDDDVMGFMTVKAATSNENGTMNVRQGALGTNRAISLTPYDGTTFNYYNSREKGKTSIHRTNVHNTRYQYCFALDSDHLIEKSRIFNLIDAFVNLGQVGGHLNDSLFDFSPESMILRWTDDHCPRFLYCFEQNENEEIVAPRLMEQIEAEDIDSKELWIGGEVSKRLNIDNAHIFRGVKATAKDIKIQIAKDLDI